MTVSTGGPIRGLLGRWLMRIEAAGSILRMLFLGLTAASTLTSALALIGLEALAPFVLAAGVAGTLAFSYLYVETGVLNRKNRERHDWGSNFAGPKMRMDDELIGRAVFAAVHGREPDDEESEAISQAVDGGWRQFRNGVALDDD